jgi:hypothetical protein
MCVVYAINREKKMKSKKQEQSDAAYGALWKNKFAGNNKAPFLTGELTLSEAFIENLICRYDKYREVKLSIGGWKRIAESNEEPYLVLKFAFPLKRNADAETDDWEVL